MIRALIGNFCTARCVACGVHPRISILRIGCDARYFKQHHHGRYVMRLKGLNVRGSFRGFNQSSVQVGCPQLSRRRERILRLAVEILTINADYLRYFFEYFFAMHI